MSVNLKNLLLVLVSLCTDQQFSTMVYSLQERIEIIFIYGEEQRCARRTARVFNERHPDKNLGHQYVLDLVNKFQETGSVGNKIVKNRRVLTEAAQIEILGNFAMDPQTSIPKVSRLTNISVGSVHKTLRLNKFFPYKIQLLQQLAEDDYDRRIEFCEIVTERANEDHNFIKNICFTDEASFFLNGFVNKHNCRYWDNINPHIFREEHTQYPQKINVWAGILGNKIIGPIFMEENLTGELYLDLLENVINPLITESLENQIDQDGNLLLDEENLFFQQDGAPPHYALPVRNWLNETFPDKWIGRRGAIEWPARSPDLTPLDFFLWGHLKSVVYKTQPRDIPELRRRIVEECQRITPETFQNLREQFELRLYHCLTNNGGHFEHLI